MNEVRIEGRLTKAPEVMYHNDQTLLKLSIAENKWRKLENGEFVQTDKGFFLDIAWWTEDANHIASLLTKGDEIVAFGELQGSVYTDNEGVERRSLSLRANQIALKLRRIKSITRVPREGQAPVVSTSAQPPQRRAHASSASGSEPVPLDYPPAYQGFDDDNGDIPQ
ncbi:single-stranded DNA-binding protein [Parachitinimonas caeni]|uniref:Single-stranded DNA-binding protein n=1 Tax=Parachitinimonas caeni TaxID=3031301 RepID=A0ABT7E2E7_9NEIS|nr:single-stranded DNA-binding protein [Parachitinimonas caeni]MDK2126478.1 single-stranded DNA-binding protein [Parachitinimonas caeni]